MLSKRFNLLFLFFIYAGSYLNSQDSREDLEREREINIKKIEEAEKILFESEKTKTVSIGKLRVINKQIINRQSLINSLRSDIVTQNQKIKSLVKIISSLNNDIKILSNEYSDMIYNSYKSRSSLTKLGYIFSSRL